MRSGCAAAARLRIAGSVHCAGSCRNGVNTYEAGELIATSCVRVRSIIWSGPTGCLDFGHFDAPVGCEVNEGLVEAGSDPDSVGDVDAGSVWPVVAEVGVKGSVGEGSVVGDGEARQPLGVGFGDDEPACGIYHGAVGNVQICRHHRGGTICVDHHQIARTRAVTSKDVKAHAADIRSTG